jgi:hypothetical protein
VQIDSLLKRVTVTTINISVKSAKVRPYPKQFNTLDIFPNVAVMSAYNFSLYELPINLPSAN